MKKLLIFMLVLGMASLANATVIDVITAGVGTLGHAGTSTDPLEESEIIEIVIVLNYNPSAWPSYDGYVLDGLDLDLHVSGPGTLSVPGVYGGKSPFPRVGDDLQHHADLDVWSQSGFSDGTEANYEPVVVSNGIAKLTGGSFGYIYGTADGTTGGGPADPPTALVWNMFIHCDGPGDITVDLTLRGTNNLWDYTYPTGLPYGDNYSAVEGDLGDLVIHNIPEPATIALLGLGGLFLARRRRK